MTSIKANLPDTTQGAFRLGKEAYLNCKSLEYNPYRNMDNRINHLWAAWIRGWKSQNLPERPDQAAVSE